MWGIEPATFVYGDDTPANWATQPGLDPHFIHSSGILWVLLWACTAYYLAKLFRGSFWRFLKFFFCTAISPWTLLPQIPAASAAPSSNICILHSGLPWLSVRSLLPCTTVWKMPSDRELNQHWTNISILFRFLRFYLIFFLLQNQHNWSFCCLYSFAYSRIWYSGIIQCITFTDWFLSLSNMLFRLLQSSHGFLVHFFLLLNNISLCRCTTFICSPVEGHLCHF